MNLHLHRHLQEPLRPLQHGIKTFKIKFMSLTSIKIIDLKDCFYIIPLQESDAIHFAFSVPSINKKKPVS